MTSGIIDLKTVKRPSKRKDARSFIQSLSSISPERADGNPQVAAER